MAVRVLHNWLHFNFSFSLSLLLALESTSFEGSKSLLSMRRLFRVISVAKIAMIARRLAMMPKESVNASPVSTEFYVNQTNGQDKIQRPTHF